MLPTRSTSSSQLPDERLVRVALSRLHPHPANANLMPEERLEKLARNIEREGRYPPIIVRPHPDLPGEFQLLDGHQRREALGRLGHHEAVCFLWPCDDATALILLATLNRLEGEDVPARRAELLWELRELLPLHELASILPEDAGAIEDTLALLSLDSEALLAQLNTAAQVLAGQSPRLLSFAVLLEDEPVVEQTIRLAAANLSGPNRRGRALAAVCRSFLETAHG